MLNIEIEKIGLAKVLAMYEIEILKAALKLKMSENQIAKLLKIPRSTFRSKLLKYGLK